MEKSQMTSDKKEKTKIQLEVYKVLHSKMNSEIANLSNNFNYGLVTLGICLTAIQTIFAQINEISQSSSTANIDQLNSLGLLLWLLLVLFVPFVCIVFTFKWLSIYDSVAITEDFIATKIEDEIWAQVKPPFSDNSNVLKNSRGKQHVGVVLFFFLFIGLISLSTGSHSIQLDGLACFNCLFLIVYTVCCWFCSFRADQVSNNNNGWIKQVIVIVNVLFSY